jgi:hypothetical protein
MCRPLPLTLLRFPCLGGSVVWFVVIKARQSFPLKRFTKDLLDGSDHGRIVLCDKGKGITRIFRTPGTAYPVSVRIGGIRHIEVYHMGDCRHIDSPRSDIGGHEYLV